jgi:hypothetical protein
LAVELKRNIRCLPDRDLVGALVELAKIKVGDLPLGVEGDRLEEVVKL